MGQGGHIVASRNIYGGSYNILVHTLPRFGITTTFVDPRDHAAWQAAIRPETRLVFGEILGNPGLEVLDVPAVAKIAQRSAEHTSELQSLIRTSYADSRMTPK